MTDRRLRFARDLRVSRTGAWLAQRGSTRRLIARYASAPAARRSSLASARETPRAARGRESFDHRTWPARIVRLELGSGRRLPWKELAADPAGLLYGNLLLTRDGLHYVYRLRRVLSELNVAEGIR